MLPEMRVLVPCLDFLRVHDITIRAFQEKVLPLSKFTILEPFEKNSQKETLNFWELTKSSDPHGFSCGVREKPGLADPGLSPNPFRVV